MQSVDKTSGLRVVIVTGKGPHQKNLCVKLAENHEVVGIVHPKDEPAGLSASFKKLRRQLKREGFSTVLLHALKGLPVGRAPKHNGSASELPDFKQSVEDYNRLDRSLIFSSCDVKSPEAHALLRSLRPDVTVCLGGPVYPKAFIEASPLMLNFHSGVSPIYNGTASIEFAFANGHLHLCGGTLMVMNAAVDGGGILGHYLPAIHEGDTPEGLFRRTVNGAVGMYDRLLENLAGHPGRLLSLPQPQPLFYTRGAELGWHHRVMIAARCRANLPARQKRNEKIIEYWRASDAAAAAAAYRQTIETLLWGGTMPNNQ
jgi:methionyl-tRNA formyltransferase